MTSFTFIMPACGVARYVGAAIASLKAQTVEKFEAIVVCEESTDGTLAAVENAVDGDPRFTIVPMPCSGSASVSRNYGITHAHGDYVAFIDGDDWVAPDYLAVLTKAAEHFGHPDLILIDWMFHESGSVRLVRCHELRPETIYTGVESLAERLETFFQPGSPANVCRRRFLLDEKLFQIPGRRHQDSEWMPRVNFAAETVVYLPFAGYHYVKRPGSVTTRPDPKSMADLTDNLISYFDFRESRPIPPRLVKPLADWCGENFNCYFGLAWGKPYPAALRRREYLRLTANGGWRRCRAALAGGGVSKKMFLPILAMARIPGLFRVSGVLYRSFRRLALPVLAGLRRRLA